MGRDVLVNLYEIPDAAPAIQRCRDEGVNIRRPRSYEMGILLRWITRHFSAGWATEVVVCFGNHPVSAFIATEGGHLRGFCCYDSCGPNMVGPIGVADSARGRGIGAALLLASLHAERDAGFYYAVIPDAGGHGLYTGLAKGIQLPWANVVHVDRLARDASHNP